MGFVRVWGRGEFWRLVQNLLFRVTICTRFTFESACLEKYFYESQPILYLYFKRSPAEAAFASHKLMIRAGLIKANASGLYTWMPMGLRVLRKVENVVREEMARAGSVELLMPVVQPAELWQESGRWEFTVKNCCA